MHQRWRAHTRSETMKHLTEWTVNLWLRPHSLHLGYWSCKKNTPRNSFGTLGWSFGAFDIALATRRRLQRKPNSRTASKNCSPQAALWEAWEISQTTTVVAFLPRWYLWIGIPEIQDGKSSVFRFRVFFKVGKHHGVLKVCCTEGYWWHAEKSKVQTKINIHAESFL